MSLKEKLDTKYSVQDPVHLAEFNSWADTAFGYRGYSKITNFTWDWQSIDPTRSADWNKTLDFNIPKGAHYIGPMYLKATIGALANTGGTSRFVDYLGFAMYPNIYVRYLTNQLQSIDHRVMQAYHKVYKKTDTQEAHDVLLAGNLSSQERTSLATGTQTIITPLPIFFTDHIHKFFLNEAITHDLKISVDTAQLLDVVQSTAGTPTGGAIVELELIYLSVYLQDEERDAHVDKTLDGAGEVMAINDYETQLDNDLGSGSSVYTIKITDLKSPTFDLRFCIRDYNTVTTQNSNTRDYYNMEYYPALQWYLTSSSVQITQNTTGLENIFHHNALYWPGRIGTPFYGYVASLDPTDKINSLGHDNYSGFANPQLKLTFDVNLTADKICDIFAFTKNTTQEVKGEVVKNFL